MTQSSATNPLSTTPTRPRVQWVDYAKGIGIFLVVVYHVWKGLGQRIQIDDAVFSDVDRALEMTHMPMFFLVAGLFIVRSVQKGWWSFLADKLRTIAWPYVVWSTVAVLAGLMMAKLSHTTPEITWRELPGRLVYRPVNEFWFLYVLLIALVVMLVLVKCRVPVWLIFIASFAFYYAGRIPWETMNVRLGRYEIGPAHFGPLFQLMRFLWLLALGMWAGPWLLKRLPAVSALWLVLVAIVGMWIVVFAVRHHSLPFYRMTIDRVFPTWELHMNVGWWFALSAVSAVIAIAALMDRVRGLGLVRKMGEDSLQIYVLHVICLATVRMALFKLHVNGLAPQLIAGVVAGVAIPMLIASMARGAEVDWIFTLKPSQPRPAGR